MSNNFYTKSGNPGPNSPGSSTTIRAEFELIQDGFEKMPTITGNANKPIRVNSAGTALEASAAQSGLAITASTVDSTPVGATTPSTGAFTTLSTTGNATIGGALSAPSATFSGGMTGDVSGDVTSTGTSSFQNIELSGSFTSNGVVVTAPVWVSGTTYSIGDVRVSPIHWQSYRRITSGAGTTDPSADATNWALVTNSLIVVDVSGTWQNAVANRN